MKTLIICMRYNDPQIKLVGLSFKALKGTDVTRNLYRGDAQEYSLDTTFHINGRTAQIELSYLVKSLKEIYARIPFHRIKINGSYEINEIDLFKLVIN